MIKYLIEFPKPSLEEVASDGVKGIHDSISPVSRNFGLLSEMSNMIRAKETAASTRPGRVGAGRIGVPPCSGGCVTGMVDVPASTGFADPTIIASSGTQWHLGDLDTSSWSVIKSGLTDGAMMEGEAYGNLMILVNGEDAPQKLDLVSGLPLEDLGGTPPVSPYIEVAYNRVFMVEMPHLLRASDTTFPEEWLAGDSFSAPVNDKDGDEIKWIQMYQTNLMIWKRHSLHELHGPEVGNVSGQWRILAVGDFGAVNGRTIADIDGVLFWLSDSNNTRGVVAWSGGRPKVISGPVDDIISRINFDAIETAAGASDGEGRYILSLPIDSATTPNVVLVYNSGDASWWVWHDWSPTAFTINKSTGSLYFGDSDGEVYLMGGDTDDGIAIDYTATFGPSHLGGDFDMKRPRRMLVAATVPDGSTMELSASAVDVGDYGSPVSITGGSAIKRARRFVPLNTGEPHSNYVLRMLVEGSGPATIHNVGVQYSFVEG